MSIAVLGQAVCVCVCHDRSSAQLCMGKHVTLLVNGLGQLETVNRGEGLQHFNPLETQERFHALTHKRRPANKPYTMGHALSPPSTQLAEVSVCIRRSGRSYLSSRAEEVKDPPPPPPPAPVFFYFRPLLCGSVLFSSKQESVEWQVLLKTNYNSVNQEGDTCWLTLFLLVLTFTWFLTIAF